MTLRDASVILPPEILMRVIEYAVNYAALDAWYAATEGNELLHDFVYRQIREELDITHADLVASPEEVKKYEDRSVRADENNWNYSGRARLWEFFGRETEPNENETQREQRVKKEWFNGTV